MNWFDRHSDMKPRSRRADPGFSLVEIVLAIGIFAMIFSFVFMAVPSSLQSMNKADGKSVQGRIARGLVAEILLNDWESVMDYHQTHHYFDGEGFELEFAADSTAEPEFFAYHAYVSFSDQNIVLPGTTTEPYQGEDGTAEADLRIVTVLVTNGPSPNYDFASRRDHRTYSTWISRMNLDR